MTEKVFDLRQAARDEVRKAVAEILPKCADTISRAVALSALNGLTEIYLNNLPPTIFKTDAVEAVTALPPAQPGWIPVTERLPDVRQWVLCQCRAGIMDVLRLTADGSWNKNYPHTEYMSGFVVAWMPLPTPYREGGQDDES